MSRESSVSLKKCVKGLQIGVYAMMNETVYLALAALISISLINAFLRKNSLLESKNQSLSYKKRKLLTSAEWKFYATLKQFIGDDFSIIMKVRLADIIESTDKSNQTAFNKVKAKHIDFVIINKSTAAIVCCIELDDSSHEKAKTKARDKFVEKALASADVKLIRVPWQKDYSENYIAEQFQHGLLAS